jgi:hypothetical protein
VAWETRTASANRYYTRSRWAGGRVVRAYVGAAGSPTAALAAAEDAMHREAKERALVERRAEEARLIVLDAPVVALEGLSNAILAPALVAGGDRQHDRGEWRRRRQGHGAR